MKVLLICNEILKNKLEKLIKTQLNSCDITIVFTKKEYDALDFKKLKIEKLFVYVELDWYSDNSINQGYQLAVDLMNLTANKDKFIQIRFFSLNKQSDLISSAQGDRHFLTRSFQHIHLLGNSMPAFENYSKEHYEFIKLLAIKKSGILLFIKHELETVLCNISDDYQEFLKHKMQVQKHLNSILFLQSDLRRHFEVNVETLNKNDLRAFLSALLQEINLLILKESGGKKTKKLNYSVLIVEDDREMLEVLVGICEENFNEVYPSKKEIGEYNVKDAYEKLKKKGKEFNVMILDLLFEKKDTSYELFSGTDFLKEAKSRFPFLTIRVVTNVSRQIIGPILELPIKDLYPKNMGKSALREFIINDIERIKEDCLAKEESKKIRNIGPKIGFFNFPSVWDKIESLIESDSFNTFWQENGLRNLREYINTSEISNFDGTLPKNDDKYKKIYSIDEIEKYFKNVFTFRLLFLDYFAKNSTNYKLEAEAIEFFEKQVLQKLCSRENCDNNFLNMIAISVSQSKKDLSLTIMLKNLFPQEVEWLMPQLKIGLKLLISDIYPQLANWFIEIRKSVKTELVIDFLDITKKDFDFLHFNKFLDEILSSPKLNLKFTDYLQDTFDSFNVSNVNLPKATGAKLDAIFTKFEGKSVEEDE